jgi:hypothetical protein
MAGLLPSCLRAFSALPDFLSSVQHFLNVPSVAVQRTFPGRACVAPQKPGKGAVQDPISRRNLLRIYSVPFCVGSSQSRLEPNGRICFCGVCFSIHLWTAFVDCVCGLRFFLDRSWTGNANEQPISPPADGLESGLSSISTMMAPTTSRFSPARRLKIGREREGREQAIAARPA